MVKQEQAANHIHTLLIQRGVDIISRKLTVKDNQQWTLFECGERQVAIDINSGIWVRASINQEWRCIATPHSLSSALIAVEFLTTD